jgi:hypothetical protein
LRWNPEGTTQRGSHDRERERSVLLAMSLAASDTGDGGLSGGGGRYFTGLTRNESCQQRYY